MQGYSQADLFRLLLQPSALSGQALLPVKIVRQTVRW